MSRLSQIQLPFSTQVLYLYNIQLMACEGLAMTDDKLGRVYLFTFDRKPSRQPNVLVLAAKALQPTLFLCQLFSSCREDQLGIVTAKPDHSYVLCAMPLQLQHALSLYQEAHHVHQLSEL